jgi:transglutaminase-like putative cysteine protease
MTDVAAYLGPTTFLDSDRPAVAGLAASLARATPRETSVALFYWVRAHCIEYVAERCSFADVPFDAIQASIRGLYDEGLLRAAREARAARMPRGD